MGYTKGETYTQTSNLTGPVTVADAQYYENDVYAKTLTINNKKLSVTDVTVESGGMLSAGNATADTANTLTGVTVGNAGSARIYNYQKAEELTVLSGGRIYTRNNVTLHNIDIKSGATWMRMDSAYLGGYQTNIASGVNYLNANGDTISLGDGFCVSNGLICNLDLKYENTSRFYIYDIKVSGAKVSSGTWLRIMTGYTTSVTDTVVHSGGSLYAETGDSIKISKTVVSSGGVFFTSGNYIEGLTVKAGGSVTKLFTGAQKLVGRDFDIESGADIAGYTDVFTDETGAIHNIRVAAGAELHLLGAAAVDPTINGTLTISNGGSVSAAAVNGTVNVSSGGLLSGAMISPNGKVNVSNYAAVSKITVGSDGSLSGATADATTDSATFTSVTVDNGGTFTVGLRNNVQNAVVSAGGTLIASTGVNISGLTVKSDGTVTKLFTGAVKLLGRDFDIESGADIAGYTDIYTDESGAIHNIRNTTGAFHLVDASAVDLKTNGTFYASSGTSITGLSTVDQTGAGAAIFYRYTVCDDPNFVSGNYLTFNFNGVTLGGANATVTDTEIRYCSNNSRTAYTADERITIQNGAITGMTLVSSGNWLKQITLNNGITAETPEVSSGGTLDVCDAAINGATVHANGAMNISAGATVNDLVAETGARVAFVRDALFTGSDTNVAANTFYYDGAADALGFSIRNGVVSDLGSDGKAYRIRLGDGLVVSDAVVRDDWRISAFGDAVISGAAVIVGGTTSAAVLLKGSNTAYNVTLTGGSGYQAVLNLDGTGASASGTVVNSGGKLGIGANVASIENTVIKAGGKLLFSAGAAASTGKLIELDFTNGSSVEINKLDLINATTRVEAKGLAVGGTYTLTAGTATTTLSVCCDSTAVYDNAVQGGSTYTNAFAGKTWNFSTGKSIAVTEFSIGEAKSTAGAITTADTALNGNDRAAKWDATTSYTDSVTLANSTLAGDAWLEIDGTNISTALYGASGNYAHTVNIEAKSGEIRNLAAGAANGGSVAGVKLTLDGADVTGAAYAGGFGTVTGKTETLIADGSFTKDFYAGALANYKSTGVQTTVGDIALTVAGGEFSGNIYGASAVKSSVVGAHTAGDVTLTIENGSTTKGAQACIFAGGYATGTAANTTVYTVDSVTATISGGDWGEAAGGRGVFGGIMASGVTAQVIGNVNITISGDATMGNVYGGGWAQKSGAKSIVGDVSINIAGGTIANVFGGGTHSTSGGTTEAGEVTITVSGGDISGAIYARGQSDGDTTGTAAVIFTGAADFDCGVFGYSYVGGATGGATLSYTDYTGEFSGNIGGFDSITFDKATEMDLTTAAGDVSNGAWIFDLTERGAGLADSSLLTWSSANFENDSVKVSFADDAQAQGGWNIAAVAEAFSGTTFDVEIGGSEIATGLSYSQQIASGDYAGWGFELESGVLKFKQLA